MKWIALTTMALATALAGCGSKFENAYTEAALAPLGPFKDKLYAVRDHLAFSFTVGSVRPNPGDVIYQGYLYGRPAPAAHVMPRLLGRMLS